MNVPRASRFGFVMFDCFFIQTNTASSRNFLDHKVCVEKVSQLELTLCEPQNFSKTLSLFYD